MRSFLFAPPDERQLAQALESGADALVIDLAAAHPSGRVGARSAVARFLETMRGRSAGPALIVRPNALDSGEIEADLDSVMVDPPEAILLPRSLGAESVQELSSKLAVREALYSLADGATGIIAAAETAQALLNLGGYRGATERLIGVVWSAESLRRDIGATTERDRDGRYFSSYGLARDLTLLAATSAGVQAIDTAFPNVGDEEGLRAEARAARHDGFAGKIAIDAVHAAIINEIFS
jgi:citrate lyase subunit beta / citryl-CoA lyase